MPDPNRRVLPAIPLVLTKDMIDKFEEICSELAVDRQKASTLMSFAISIFLPSELLDGYTRAANAAIDESYDRGHADGRTASEIHIHVPEGSSLVKEGNVLIVRPGDMADWRPVDSVSST